LKCFVRALFRDAGEKQYKFEEILPIYKQVSADSEAGTFADFMEAFKTFDREGQGFINAAELRHVLTSLGLSSPLCFLSLVFDHLEPSIDQYRASVGPYLSYLIQRGIQWGRYVINIGGPTPSPGHLSPSSNPPFFSSL